MSFICYVHLRFFSQNQDDEQLDYRMHHTSIEKLKV